MSQRLRGVLFNSVKHKVKGFFSYIEIPPAECGVTETLVKFSPRCRMLFEIYIVNTVFLYLRFLLKVLGITYNISTLKDSTKL